MVGCTPCLFILAWERPSTQCFALCAGGPLVVAIFLPPTAECLAQAVPIEPWFRGTVEEWCTEAEPDAGSTY